MPPHHEDRRRRDRERGSLQNTEVIAAESSGQTPIGRRMQPPQLAQRRAVGYQDLERALTRLLFREASRHELRA
jgi:hypothetical protein